MCDDPWPELLNGGRTPMARGVRQRYEALSEFCHFTKRATSPDFRRRFLSLLSFKFRDFGSVTALSVLEAANAGVKKLDEDASRGLCTFGAQLLNSC